MNAFTKAGDVPAKTTRFCGRIAIAALFLGTTVATAQECDDWENDHPAWLFCDDFESGGLGEWIDVNGIDVSSSAADAHDGSHAAELPYSSGSTGAGWMWVKNLRPHSSGTDSQYIRWWQRWEDGFVFQEGSGDQKLFMLDALDPVNEWGQTANWKLYIHMADSGADNNELVIDRHISATNDWQVYRQGDPGVRFDTDQWYCIEVEVAHNSPGMENGGLRVWIDDEVVLDESGVRLRDDSTSWNAIQLNAWYGGSVPVDQAAWVDQVVVSRSRIGCGAAPTRPNPPTGLDAQ